MTYVALNDIYEPKDMKLICEFHLRDDIEYKLFEKTKLLGNNLFYEFYETSKGTGLYIFDLSSFAEDWELFLEGKYSKFTLSTKALIFLHHSTNKYHKLYIDSYLNPDNYYEDYATLLGCDLQILKKVGELCDKPNLHKESLQVKLKNITFDTSESKLKKL
jgi:hypothetical protein